MIWYKPAGSSFLGVNDAVRRHGVYISRFYILIYACIAGSIYTYSNCKVSLSMGLLSCRRRDAKWRHYSCWKLGLNQAWNWTWLGLLPIAILGAVIGIDWQFAIFSLRLHLRRATRSWLIAGTVRCWLCNEKKRMMARMMNRVLLYIIMDVAQVQTCRWGKWSQYILYIHIIEIFLYNTDNSLTSAI